MEDIDSYIAYYNQKITNELTDLKNRIITDLKKLNIDINTNRSNTNRSNTGGGRSEDITKLINDVNRGTENAKPLIDQTILNKLRLLVRETDEIVNMIKKLDLDTINNPITNVNNIKHDYDMFKNKFDELLMSKGYRFGNSNMLFSESDNSNNFFESLYNIWAPFVTNIDDIFNNTEDEKVIETLILQNDKNIEILGYFEQIVDTIMKSIDNGFMNPNMYIDYYFLKKKNGNTSIDYETQNALNEIQKPIQGAVMLTLEKQYDYMNNIDLTDSGLLEFAKSGKIRHIREYIDIIKNNKYKKELTDNDYEKLEMPSQRLMDSIKDFELGKMQIGGGDDNIDNINETNKVPLSLYEFINKLTYVNNKMERVKNFVKTINLNQQRTKYYITYMAQISSLKDAKRLNIFRYINRGILDFYLNIVNDISTRIDIDDDTNYDAIYFDICHGIVIKRMTNMLKFLVENMTTTEIIDINSCKGVIQYDFVIFNHFKDILDSYYETIQNNVSIYARINDYIPNRTPIEQFKLFKVDKQNRQRILTNPTMCQYKNIYGRESSTEFDNAKAKQYPFLATDKKLSVKFNMVFDSDEFKGNEDISMYMSIGTTLSKNKSIMLLTYGYSGTGKTYTLFGNGESKGLLQSAIENMPTKGNIYYRIYELYGEAVKYPFYWCDSVAETCYDYYVDPNTQRIRDVRQNSIDDFDKNLNEKYTLVKKRNTSSFFKNFDKIVMNIDARRKKENRIRETPNNPESSRSIIMYDFLIETGNSCVNLVVVDLPGREEIIDTYTNEYILTHEKFNEPLHKAILSSMAIDPLYLAILCPDLIVQTYNQLSESEREYIINQELAIDDLGTCFDRQNDCIDDEKLKFRPEHTPVKFSDEIVVFVEKNRKREPLRIRDMITISNKHYIKMVDDKIYLDTKWKNDKHLPKEITDIQYRAVIAIHLLNRILLIKNNTSFADTKYNKFDILNKIYDEIIKKYGYEEYEKYARSPFEGIYINENIVGLLKVLITNENLLNKSQNTALKILSPQKKMSFTELKRKIREDNTKLYVIKEENKSKSKPFRDSKFIPSYQYDNDILDKIYNDNSQNYSSQRIFRFCTPNIEKIIKYYTEDRTINLVISNDKTMPKNVTGVRDAKVFYLFSNVDQEKKCVHQYNLFKNTLGLMDIVSNINI